MKASHFFLLIGLAFGHSAFAAKSHVPLPCPPYVSESGWTGGYHDVLGGRLMANQGSGPETPVKLQDASGQQINANAFSAPWSVNVGLNIGSSVGFENFFNVIYDSSLTPPLTEAGSALARTMNVNEISDLATEGLYGLSRFLETKRKGFLAVSSLSGQSMPVSSQCLLDTQEVIDSFAAGSITYANALVAITNLWGPSGENYPLGRSIYLAVTTGLRGADAVIDQEDPAVIAAQNAKATVIVDDLNGGATDVVFGGHLQNSDTWASFQAFPSAGEWTTLRSACVAVEDKIIGGAPTDINAIITAKGSLAAALTAFDGFVTAARNAYNAIANKPNTYQFTWATNFFGTELDNYRDALETEYLGASTTDDVIFRLVTYGKIIAAPLTYLFPVDASDSEIVMDSIANARLYRSWLQSLEGIQSDPARPPVSPNLVTYFQDLENNYQETRRTKEVAADFDQWLLWVGEQRNRFDRFFQQDGTADENVGKVTAQNNAIDALKQRRTDGAANFALTINDLSNAFTNTYYALVTYNSTYVDFMGMLETNAQALITLLNGWNAKITNLQALTEAECVAIQQAVENLSQAVLRLGSPTALQANSIPNRLSNLVTDLQSSYLPPYGVYTNYWCANTTGDSQINNLKASILQTQKALQWLTYTYATLGDTNAIERAEDMKVYRNAPYDVSNIQAYNPYTQNIYDTGLPTDATKTVAVYNTTEQNYSLCAMATYQIDGMFSDLTNHLKPASDVYTQNTPMLQLIYARDYSGSTLADLSSEFGVYLTWITGGGNDYTALTAALGVLEGVVNTWSTDCSTQIDNATNRGNVRNAIDTLTAAWDTLIGALPPLPSPNKFVDLANLLFGSASTPPVWPCLAQYKASLVNAPTGDDFYLSWAYGYNMIASCNMLARALGQITEGGLSDATAANRLARMQLCTSNVATDPGGVGTFFDKDISGVGTKITSDAPTYIANGNGTLATDLKDDYINNRQLTCPLKTPGEYTAYDDLTQVAARQKNGMVQPAFLPNMPF